MKNMFIKIPLTLCILLLSVSSTLSVMTVVSNDSSSDNPYCAHPECSARGQHTLCACAGRASPRLLAAGMTPWTRHTVLQLHNRHRDNVALGLQAGHPPAANMRKLYWDPELERAAAAWARQCPARHDECRGTLRFPALQNVDVRPVLARATEAQLLADAVAAWYSGARRLAPESVLAFRRAACAAPGGCNEHWYTAAAWAGSWLLGCSQALCTARARSCAPYRRRRAPDEARNATPALAEPDAAAGVGWSPLHRGAPAPPRPERRLVSYTVCNYGPAGNVEGFPVYQAGPACSRCPQGTRCADRTHRALCAVDGDPDAAP
ncbi:hypothetical protein JYU34_000481 [Plutella xylostella]|uniref:SCP domain-containing protein n=1 Tax=Plutella xylostella TaxID=51655 RepID=A0ABQ7R7Y3_PLUXY|nr:hypothetical protein JYU34_000481 [Plutella xylostella]